MDGVLNVFKEKGMTSHDVVAKVRKIYRTKKVGHAGTLDPEVAGVLPILVGRGTKLNNYLRGNKIYIGELCLGVSTDTDDFTGKPLQIQPVPVMNSSDIKKVFFSFVGERLQKPPMYSARKIKGKKLYEYAREGEKLDVPATLIKIHQIEIINIDLDSNKVLFKVECSKGTYIRSLCRDLANELGTVGHMSYLIRMSSGNKCDIANAVPLKFLERMTDDELEAALIPSEDALSDYPSINLDSKNRFGLVNGQTKQLDFQETIENTLYRVYADSFLGLGKVFTKEGLQVVKMELLLDGR